VGLIPRALIQHNDTHTALGVTIVQYRDKISNTKVLISTARRLHAITKSYGIPLLINDRIDVALAIGAEGVHIGQDDIGEALFSACQLY
jgi:thiamine-phosphate diphosphorylase/hydroxyethylthiazole kinase